MIEVAAPWEQLGVTTLSMASVPRALDLLYSMEKKITLCLVGDTGVGKTMTVAALAARALGRGQTVAVVKAAQTGEDDDADVLVIVEGDAGGGELGDQDFVEGIVHVWTVHPDCGDFAG